MAKAFLGNTRCKLYIGSTKIKKGYVGSTLVYSAGSIVTYHIDLDTSYTEELDSDISCLSPTTFVPSKPGWTFIGWRLDTAASGDVLISKVVEDDPIDLYAVFSQNVTLTLGMDNTIYSQQTLPKYYNNGNIVNPLFSVANPTITGGTFNGWSTSPTDSTISYNAISNLSLSESTALYAIVSHDNITVNTGKGSYIVNVDGWFNGTPYIFVDNIDCSKYSGITATFVGESDANGGSATQMLYAEVGGTKELLAFSECDYMGNRNPVEFNTTKTIMFTQTSGLTSLIGYGEYDTYGFEHDGCISIKDATATLIGKSTIG